MRIPRFVNNLFEFSTGLKTKNKVPIFIIGPPRSGSTLFYESMVSYFDLGYFNNFHEKNYLNPSIAELVKRSLKKKSKSKFNSNYGVIDGLFAPSENGEFWYRFFRRKPQYVSIEDTRKKDLGQLKFAINSFINVTNKHLLIKNLPCSTRIEPILKVFPNAFWIIITRNFIDNGLSIAKMRLDLKKDINLWESVEPKGYENFLTERFDIQIFKQIELIYSGIINDLYNASNRTYLVNYEAFCNSPADTLDSLNLAFKKAGILVEKRNSDLPKKFEIKTPKLESKYLETIRERFGIKTKIIKNLNENLITKFSK